MILRRRSLLLSLAASLAALIALPAAAGTATEAAPVITHPSAPTNDSTPLVGGTGEPGATVDLTVYAGATTETEPVFTGTTTVAADGQWELEASTLAEGQYIAQAEQVDADGNALMSDPHAFEVDLTPPEVTISRPASGSATQEAAFSGTAEAGGSDVTVTVYEGETTTDSPLVEATAPVVEGGWSLTPSEPLAEGTFTAQARQTDAAGNMGTSAPHTFTVDSTPPDVSIEQKPDELTNSTTATFAFVVSEAETTLSCKLDDAPASECDSGIAEYADLLAGAHSFEVTATDAAGNSMTATYAWTVDTTPPSPVSGLVARGRDHAVVLRWTNPLDPDFDHVVVFRRGIVLFTGARSRYTDRLVFNGRWYRYRIVAYDRAGNASAPARAWARPHGRLLRPRDGSTVTTAPRLVWRGVRGATYYNVQLWRHGRKILSAWPHRARLRLHMRWTYNGGRYRLRRGEYRWYVWPGFGSPAAARYGKLLGWSDFRKA
ncbi:MAG: Ig-like domain-containing protein [Actinomycetota bacterium]|nr:Ig-like domain-containing protein [Actinomycetota bacterium]